MSPRAAIKDRCADPEEEFQIDRFERQVMANSDNVLRAGLTDKHIDVPELLKHVRFEATVPAILSPDPRAGHKVYASPAEEFELHEYELTDERIAQIPVQSSEIFFLLDGIVEARSGNKDLVVHKGGALFVNAASDLTIRARRPSRLFRVTVPLPTKKNVL